MAKNPVNDNGLENSVPEAVINWYFYRSEIKKIKNKQRICSEEIERELLSARQSGYTEEEINELIGVIGIPSFYLIDE